MTVRAFGEWDAPMTDAAEWIAVPTDRFCIFCGLTFTDGDNGCINEAGVGQHRECSLRSVMGGIGHLVDHPRFCDAAGPDAGLPYRESALLVWRHLVTGPPVTLEEL